ncbi:MAG: hypothetical protein LBV40_05160 [Methanomicrobiales archaeon]|nr:hypothetical protein [Methanomicrobiales archaeon]
MKNSHNTPQQNGLSYYTQKTECDAELNTVLLSFRTKWDTLKEEERRYAIQDIADYLAKVLVLGETPLILYANPSNSHFLCADCKGSYNNNSNTTYININLMNDAFTTINTIAHEMTHAYQHKAAPIGTYTEEELKVREGTEIVGQFTNAAYRCQPVEIDARMVGDAMEEKVKTFPRLNP